MTNLNDKSVSTPSLSLQVNMLDVNFILEDQPTPCFHTLPLDNIVNTLLVLVLPPIQAHLVPLLYDPVALCVTAIHQARIHKPASLIILTALPKKRIKLNHKGMSHLFFHKLINLLLNFFLPKRPL